MKKRLAGFLLACALSTGVGCGPKHNYVKFDNVANTLTVHESFFDLAGPATGAHIHCCTPPGTNTGIAVPYTAFPATKSGVKGANGVPWMNCQNKPAQPTKLSRLKPMIHAPGMSRSS